MSRLHSILALLAFAGALVAADVVPAPAKVIKDGKDFPGHVTSETLDGGLILVDDPRAANPVSTKFPPGTYQVEYRDSQHKDLLQARSFAAKGVEGADKAIQSYTAAVASCRYDWERQEAYIGIARAAEAAKKYDAGVTALSGFEKDYPKGVLLPEVVFQKGRLLALKGDQAGAIKVLEGLRGKAKEWGVAAAVKGSLGIAEIHAREDKHAEAAAELAQWSGKIDPAKHPADFGAAMLALAQAQHRAAMPAAADTFKQVAFSAAPQGVQAAAHLGWARLLSDKGDPASMLAAFDHAAIAAALKDADLAVRGEALKLAKGLVPKIASSGADDNQRNQLTIEYNDYIRKLQ